MVVWLQSPGSQPLLTVQLKDVSLQEAHRAIIEGLKNDSPVFTFLFFPKVTSVAFLAVTH